MFHPAGITEITTLVGGLLFNKLAHSGGSIRRYGKPVGRKVVDTNLHKLLNAIVIEVKMMWEPTPQSGIGIQHPVHVLGISRHDDHHIWILIREHGEQAFYGPVAVVLAVIGSVDESICLIDE